MSPSRFCVLSRRLQNCGACQRTWVEIRTDADFMSMVVYQETGDLERWPNLEEYLLEFLSFCLFKKAGRLLWFLTLCVRNWSLRVSMQKSRFCSVANVSCEFHFSKEESQTDPEHRNLNRVNHFWKKKWIESKSVWSFVKVLLNIWRTICFLQWSLNLSMHLF